jgi:hypothetical protein
VGPPLARLTAIQFRMAWSLLTKARRSWLGEEGNVAPVPAWIARRLAEQGEARDRIVVIPAYTYRAPGVGFCRAGYAVWSLGVPHPRAAGSARGARRLSGHGSCGSGSQSRDRAPLVVLEELAADATREHVFTLFRRAPRSSKPRSPGSRRGGVGPRSPRTDSARRGLPARGRASRRRYVAAADAGSLD